MKSANPNLRLLRVEPRAGQVIGEQYRLEELLERGAMGSVWRAEQIRLRAPVAIKFLDPSLIEDPQMRDRFMQEARSAAAVRSANVVQIFDYGSDGDVPYIAMELLEGESLGARLSNRGTLTPAELNKIFREVARGIGQAHAMGVVHRDVKPDNIFIVREGEHEVTKLIDFGIAKVKTDALSFTQIIGTKLGTLLGTPQYMSPEQVRGSAALDYRTDLWALAIIACECLTGRYPFPGTTLGDLTVQICTERPRAPSTLGEVPSGFDRWFFKGTSKKPSQRFASVEEMADALDEILLASVASAAAASSGWLSGLLRRVELRRLLRTTTGRLPPLSTLARHTISGWGVHLGKLAPTLYGAALAAVHSERWGLRRLIGSRAGRIVSALVIAGLAVALSSLLRGAREPAPEEPPARRIQAASPAPAENGANVAATLPLVAASPPHAPIVVARMVPNGDLDLGIAREAPPANEPNEVAVARRPRQRPSLPTLDQKKTPLGPMSIAMGEAGARIASGGVAPGRARPAAATPAKARTPLRKAPERSHP
jgi:eukaryotic-like serine/threonine-protein kinase